MLFKLVQDLENDHKIICMKSITLFLNQFGITMKSFKSVSCRVVERPNSHLAKFM